MGFPLISIEIHGQDQSYELESTTTTDRPYGVTASGDLIECRIEKRKNSDSPAGIFEIQLVRSKDAQGRTWRDKIRPQDVVVIQMQNYQGTSGRNGAGELHTVMIGLVDSVQVATTLSASGKPQRVIQVKGTDFGKIFKAGIVTYWSFLGATLLGENGTGKMENFIDASQLNTRPDRICATLIDKLFRRFMDIRFRVQQHDYSIFDILAQQLESYGIEVPAGHDYQFLNGEGNFWSFFTKVASPPFHELWIDTRRSTAILTENQDPLFTTIRQPTKYLGKDNSCPTLIMRKTPFPYLTSSTPLAPFVPVQFQNADMNVNADRWNAMRTTAHRIGRDDLVGEPFDEVISVSDEEQYNFYFVFANYAWMPDKPYILSVPGIIDRTRFRKYGYRPMTMTTALFHGPELSTADPAGLFYTSLNWRMASWNCLNDWFESGYKTCKLLPHVHVGEILVDESDWQEQPKEYYIESIIHHYIYNERATTTLGLTRGLTSKEYTEIDVNLRKQGLELVLPTATTDIYNQLTGVS